MQERKEELTQELLQINKELMTTICYITEELDNNDEIFNLLDEASTKICKATRILRLN
jgi:hypothetical protein